MKFIVGTQIVADDTCDPALDNCKLRDKPIVRLADAPVSIKRQLTLVEEEGAGGPVMLMLNNSRWNGHRYMIGEPIAVSQVVYGQDTVHSTSCNWRAICPALETTPIECNCLLTSPHAKI